MPVVAVVVNGRRYELGCDDGQEGHVLRLADEVDRRVQQLAARLGAVDEMRLLLLASLLLADEVADLRAAATRAIAAGAAVAGEMAGEAAGGAAGEPSAVPLPPRPGEVNGAAPAPAGYPEGSAEALAAGLHALAARIETVTGRLADAAADGSAVASTERPS